MITFKYNVDIFLPINNYFNKTIISQHRKIHGFMALMGKKWGMDDIKWTLLIDTVLVVLLVQQNQVWWPLSY
jgi:hypothetical protein